MHRELENRSSLFTLPDYALNSGTEPATSAAASAVENTIVLNAAATAVDDDDDAFGSIGSIHRCFSNHCGWFPAWSGPPAATLL